MGSLLEATRNYAAFHGLSKDAVCPRRLAKSFGGVDGWASLLSSKLPRCLPQLQGVLMDTSFPEQLLCSMAQRNYHFLVRQLGEDSRPSDLSSDVEQLQLKWSLPSFCLAKEGYEAFKNIAPGKARLKDVLASSAGVFGWECYASSLDPGPSQVSTRTPEPSSDDEDDSATTSQEEDDFGLAHDHPFQPPPIKATGRGSPPTDPSSCFLACP